MTDSLANTNAPRPGPGTARAIVLIAIVALFAYFSSLHGDYVLDDNRFTGDPKIGHPWASSMISRPVIAFSLALNYWVDGLNSRGYHALNLTVHGLATLFLYLLIRWTLLLPRFEGKFEAWADWLGLVCALIWMVHPLQTQAVTYIVQRCESFMGMFFLASFWFYVRGAAAERGRWWYVASVVCCTLGTGCKEMMPTLVPLALLYDRTFLTGSWRESLRRRWVALALLAVPPLAGVLVLVFQGFFTAQESSVGFGVKLFTPYTYALTQTEVILHYLRLAFYPVGLALDYVDWKPCQSLADCWPTLSAIAILLAIAAIGIWRRSAWSFPAAWFFIILAPTSSIVPVQDAAFEHRMYLSLAGIVVLVVCGIAWAALTIPALRGRTSGAGLALGCLAGLAIFVLGLLTASRSEDYSSSGRMYADNVAKRPANGRARLNLALQLFASGNVAGAETQLNEALRLPYRFPGLQMVLVRVLRELGRTTEAVQLAEQMVASKPDSDEAEFELGFSLLSDGRPAEALPHLKRAEEKLTGNKRYTLYLGIALEETGRSDEALPEYRTAAELDSGYAAQLIRIAKYNANDPNAKPSHLRMACLYAMAACRMSDQPQADYFDTYAIALARLGKFSEAVNESKKASSLALENGNSYLAERINARAEGFRAGKPYLPEQIDPQP